MKIKELSKEQKQEYLEKAKAFVENMNYKVKNNQDITHELVILREMHRYISSSKIRNEDVLSLLNSILTDFEEYAQKQINLEHKEEKIIKKRK